MLRILVFIIVTAFPVLATISEQDVQNHLATAGLPIPDSINMPVVSSAIASPAMEITFIGMLGEQLWVRVHCPRSAECRPFCASFHYRDRELMQNAARRIANIHHRQAPQGPLLTKAGNRSQLILRRGDVILRFWVRCLQSGRLGDQIRARADDRRVYLARVVSKDSLEAQW